VSATEITGVQKTAHMYLQFKKCVSVTRPELILNKRLLEKTGMDFKGEETSSCVVGPPMPCLDSELQQIFIHNLNYWVMHPVARVSINIYIETSVRNKCRCSF
jgi:hypothetical protein